MEFNLYFIILSLMIMAASCNSGQKVKDWNDIQPENDPVIQAPNVSDTTLVFRFGEFESEVIVRTSEKPFKGTILMLQGWNFPNTSWCDSTDFCMKALDRGYFLVMPAMGKSIYHWKSYPQTRTDWMKYPTRDWLVNFVCRKLNEEFSLFSREHNNYIVGISTGGRGALIIAEENPEIFFAGASLSGDYDQSAYPDDNLYLGYFGSDPRNWEAKENPISSIEDWKVPMYIGHGERDPIVSAEHMLHLQSLTDTLIPSINFKYNLDPDGGHNYTYWSSEADNILQYFKSHRR